jgi:hypothetical protein
VKVVAVVTPPPRIVDPDSQLLGNSSDGVDRE